MNVINFSAGPCQLSKDLLTSTQNDILNYKNTGISIYELSHHTDMWKDLYFETVHNTSSFLEVLPHTSILLYEWRWYTSILINMLQLM